MTVPATARRAGPYNGNGSTTSFSFSFKTFAAGDLLVTRTSATGIETVLVLNSDYSVTLNGDQDASPGGTITYPISGSALATGQKITIVGDLEYEQTTDLLGGGAFNARVIEDTFDRTVIQIQQLEERLDRAMVLPVSSTASAQLPSPEASKFLGWNSNGTAIVNRDGSGLVTAAAYGNWRTDLFSGNGSTVAFTLTQDPGNQNNCDVAIGGVVQTPGLDYTVSGTALTFTSAPPAGTNNVVVRYGLAIPAGITDSNLVNFVPAGTGAVTRTAQDKMRDSVSVGDFGASASASNAFNKTALQAAISAVDAAGGGVVRVPNGIDYGFKNTNLTTYPNFTGVVNDVTVIDEGIGDADNSGNKAGAQTRVFYYTKQTTPTAGLHDGNGYWIYGDWHPYYSVMNTANLAAVGNPSRTAADNRRASLVFNNDGETTWRWGQGTLAGAGYTDEELSNFVLEHYQATGDTLPNYAPLTIERKTGNWSFGAGTNAPPASYQFKSVTVGYAQAMFESLGTTAFVVLRNSNGSGEDLEIKNLAGDFVVNSQSSGNVFTIKKTSRFFGIGIDSPGYRLDVQQSQSSGYVFNYKNLSATNGSTGIFDSTSSNGVGWFFLRCFSSDQSDQEFYLRGDGNAAAEGSWTGGGADYAEYFEWADGNPDAEDRRGYSVSLVNGKIKKASIGETVIGVISGNPSVVGDAAWNKWDGKYLRDEFGSYIRNENGERILSPEYDPQAEYIPREHRIEWDCVGLMGKLRVRKGQPTDVRWIKMRDISDSVEEWLVR